MSQVVMPPASQYKEASPSNTPYKGSESYEPWDSELFFGRDDEAEHLIAKILVSRFTILHAQSGAGKTSLLNAKIIPGLQRKGWWACRIRPNFDPLASIRMATLQAVLPPPAAEIASIRRACEALEVPESATLKDIFRKYDGLSRAHPAKRGTIGSIPVDGLFAQATGETKTVPLFTRLLSATMRESDYGQHIAVLSGNSDTNLQISNATRVSDLLKLLDAPECREGHAAMVSLLVESQESLLEFLEAVQRVYGQFRTDFRIVWILDQFEEIFTRFVEPAPGREQSAETGEWTLKYRLFKEIEEVYAASQALNAAPRGTDAAEPTLPQIQFVISLRDEYVAQLDPARRYVWSIEENYYHLTLLRQPQAKAAIMEPAGIFGYEYDDDCYESILKDLTKEARFIEPAHLQIVCQKLWQVEGERMATGASARNLGANGLPAIPLLVLEGLKGAKGILKDFFTDVLKSLDRNARIEVLDMLDRLVTSHGTRNIVAERDLIHAPYRFPDRRRDLLELLRNKTIVRAEHRLDERFVEITHEFLIIPIRDAVRDGLSGGEDWRFVAAREKLGSIELNTRFHERFARADFDALAAKKEDICWDQAGAEAMIRAAIGHGLTPDCLKLSYDLYKQFSQELPHILEKMLEADPSEPLNNSDFLEVDLARPTNPALNLRQLEIVLRSALRWASSDNHEPVGYWLRRFINGQ